MMDGAEALRGQQILVVEDDYLVAQVLVDLLEDAGATVIGPIGWVDEALTLITDPAHRLDAAVLDVNLHGSKSYPIADALADRSIGFIFATGYGADALDGAYRDHRRCEKPFNQRTLIAALNDLLPQLHT
ncbi:MAG TPA: response regulator [Stellaceae bacterium]|nr:response regulator [Stellaceae bacterium]